MLEARQQALTAGVSTPETRTIHEIFDSKEKDLDQYLHFDGYRRVSFLDHFIAEPIDFESFRECEYQEEGDFIKEPYEIETKRRGTDQEVLFFRSGRLHKDGGGDPVEIRKCFSISGRGKVLKASYLINYRGEKRRTNLGVEFNINLLAGDAPDRYYEISGHSLDDRKLASVGKLDGVTEVHLVDEWNKMKAVLRTDRTCNLLRFPIETVSLSESGFEKVFQGSCLLLYWPLELEPGGEFRVSFELGIEHLEKIA